MHVAFNELVFIESLTHLEGEEEPIDSFEKKHHAQPFRIGDKLTIEGN